MTNDRIVIVGSGHAGSRAARTLRENGWEGDITMVDREDRPPYERPPLSKALLSGSADVKEPPLFADGFLEEHRITHLRGISAMAIKRDIQELELSNGESLGYHRLLLTPGAAPRKLDVPGSDLSGAYYLRTAADAQALSSDLRAGNNIVVIGGGLIGLEVAASAVGRGCNVTVVEAGPRLMTRGIPEEMASKVKALHESHGVKILTSQQVTGLRGQSQVTALELSDGSELPCSAVLVSIGIAPRIRLAQEAGLSIDNGIAVNQFLQTSDPLIYAAGDACSFADISNGQTRLECWKNAEDQGVISALNMLGANKPYVTVPWMWSDQYDKVMQVAGVPNRGRHHVLREIKDGSLLVYHLGEDKALEGISGFGSLREVSRAVRIGQKLIENGMPLEAHQIEDPKFNLKSLMQASVA